MALWAYTMYGAAITPALLAVFLWPRVTRAAAWLQSPPGMITTLGWEIVRAMRRVDIHMTWPRSIPPLALSLLALVGVSLATPPPTPEELAAVS